MAYEKQERINAGATKHKKNRSKLFRIQRLLYKLVQRRSYATSVINTTCDPMLVRWIRHRFADGDI